MHNKEIHRTIKRRKNLLSYFKYVKPNFRSLQMNFRLFQLRLSLIVTHDKNPALAGFLWVTSHSWRTLRLIAWLRVITATESLKNRAQGPVRAFKSKQEFMQCEMAHSAPAYRAKFGYLIPRALSIASLHPAWSAWGRARGQAAGLYMQISCQHIKLRFLFPLILSSPERRRDNGDEIWARKVYKSPPSFSRIFLRQVLRYFS